MSTKNREPAEQQPATSAFPNQMIEQINARSWAKRVQEFLSLGQWSRRRLTSEKETVYIN